MANPALSYSFAGKKVLITGGGSGVGLTLVTRLHKDGAHVFTLEKDATLVDKLRKEFPGIRAEVADVSNWSQTQKLIESFGPLDHLVNNAGIVMYGIFLQANEDQFSRQMDVNLKGMFVTSQAVAKGMISAGIKGSIVSVASCGAHVALDGICIYSVTKAGVIMLTKCMASELGKYGIRCNSVSPTAIDTPMFRAGNAPDESKKASKKLWERQPLAGKNILDADEVVNTILYLLSPLSSMATGTDVVLDGGITVC